ncbi:MAG: hypothetical protein A3J52_00660 [Omnitrophica bacterium RIFCSPHIGHO2_02_FULL_49_9]|nr:MAG: hypothetical protein A3J52_00660 [Omnitrophica bacterium RIFCSPHIGHO2_02_FULL_49_9]
MANGESSITGGPAPQGPSVAPKGRRFASDIIDLLIIPIILGIAFGIMLLAVPEGIRNFSLIAVNILWLVFRDYVFSPGRKLVGLKLVSVDGAGKAGITGAIIRNITLAIPFVLTTGYGCEIARVFIPTLIWRRAWYAALLVIALAGGIPAAISAASFLLGVAVLGVAAVPIIFLVLDKENLPAGDRLMDVYARTRVTSE